MTGATGHVGRHLVGPSGLGNRVQPIALTDLLVHLEVAAQFPPMRKDDVAAHLPPGFARMDLASALRAATEG